MPKIVTRLDQLYEASPWEEGDTELVERFRWLMPDGKHIVIYDSIYGQFGWRCISNIIENKTDVLTQYPTKDVNHKIIFKTTRLWKIFMLSNGKLELVDEENESKIITLNPKIIQ